MSTQNTEANQTIAQLVEQTGIDAEFRAEFLANPRAIYASKGIEIPDDVEIVVVESSADTAVLPLLPYIGDKLSSEQLEDVSGGLDPVTGGVLITGIAVGGGLGLATIGGAVYGFSKVVNAVTGRGK